jgi:hypothetical protein
MKAFHWVVVLILTVIMTLALGGCMSMPRVYSGPAPIYPKPGYGWDDRYPAIGTLQPELRWQEKRNAGESYDVCIWELPDLAPQSSAKLAYCRSGIAENVHQVDVPLRPDVLYLWAVRTRKGQDVSQWSSFWQSELIGAGLVGTQYHFNTMYGFRTTKTKEQFQSAETNSASEKFVVIEGGYCNETDDCVRGLACSNHACVKPVK